MNTLRNILIGTGTVSIIVFLVLLVIGIKVVGSVLLFIFGTLAVVATIGIIIYYIGKLSGSRNRDNV